jgi:hypothetical protein
MFGTFDPALPVPILIFRGSILLSCTLNAFGEGKNLFASRFINTPEISFAAGILVCPDLLNPHPTVEFGGIFRTCLNGSVANNYLALTLYP